MVARKVLSSSVMLGALLLSISAQAEAKRYLVQFKSTQTYRSVTANIRTNAMTAPGVMAPMRLFNGGTVVAQNLDNVELLVVEADEAGAIRSLQQHPAVAMVEEEVFHPAPKPMATFSPGANPSAVSNLKVDMPWGITAVKAPTAWNVTKGQGARVLVLDTGLDVGHPAIAGRFERGQNFTGGDANDISDQVGHGTHVSGTILASGQNGGLIGVAPKAALLMGKVCSDRGCSSVAIASGIDWAVSQHVDVVNMSLGGAFLSAGEQRALDKAEQAGVMIVAASGNDGTGNVSYPGAYTSVLAVGAVDSDLKKAEFSQWGPELGIVGPGVDVVSSVPRGTGRGSEVRLDLDGKGLNVVKSLPFQGSPVLSSDNTVVFAGLGKPEDFAKVDVRGKTALIARGELPFKDKLANAIKAGAVAMLVYNNAPGLIQGSLSEDGSEVAIPAAMIEQTAGEALKNSLSSNPSLRVSLNVVRTDYASLQGTSMATPHVAGVAALVRAANHGLTPAQVRTLLKQTATAMGPNDENQYGAGLVNAAAAVAQAGVMNFAPVRQAAN